MLLVRAAVVRAPPGERWMLGYCTIDLSNSTSTMHINAEAQPLSSPVYLPGDAVVPGGPN